MRTNLIGAFQSVDSTEGVDQPLMEMFVLVTRVSEIGLQLFDLSAQEGDLQ